MFGVGRRLVSEPAYAEEEVGGWSILTPLRLVPLYPLSALSIQAPTETKGKNN